MCLQLGKTSRSGTTQLRIKFPDGGEDDIAILEPLDVAAGKSNALFDNDKSCVLNGNLLHDSSVLVTVAGPCPLDDTFEVYNNMS